ncbi:hypothetical protein J6590_070201 [Homalodisca vitripennis]|nr:hypothetical protein J6590_070201 [Homalodisca vitripennis]
MPRPPAVAHERLKAAILNAKGVIDTNGKIPGPSNFVWTLISESLTFLVMPSYVYQYVKENRHNSYTELKKYNGISAPEPITLISNSSESNGSTDKSPILSDTPVEQILPQKSFKIVIPQSEWENFKPIDKRFSMKDRSKSRHYKILPQLRWTQTLSKYKWEQHKLPCPYTFKRATVYKDIFLGYIRIAAECKECGASAIGPVIEERAPGCDVQLEWLAK